MANVARPCGAKVVGHLNGSTYNGQATAYVVLSTEANQINVGDFVKSFAGADASGVPAVTKIVSSAGSTPVRGVVVGTSSLPLNGTTFAAGSLDMSKQNIPATKTQNYYVWVADSPDIVIEVQCATAIALNRMNNNVSYAVTNPTAPAQNSATVLYVGDIGTTAALPLRLLGAVQNGQDVITDSAGNAAINVWYRLKINNHEFGNAVTGT